MNQSSSKETREKVISVLNKSKALELHAISQYMYQHYILDDLDYGELAANVKLISIDEMRHSEEMAERIKELGGEPVTDPSQPVKKGQGIEDIFSYNMAQEQEAMDVYNKFLKVCQDKADTVSAQLFEKIIAHEQEHYNYFQNVLEHIETLGNAFLSRKAGTSSDTGPSKGFSY